MALRRAPIARLVGTVCLLALASGPWLRCTGWQTMPGDRMACCTEDDRCPMHEDGAHADHAAPPLAQADADRCCAMSESDDTPQVATTPIAAAMPLVQLTGSAAMLVVNRHGHDDQRSRNRIPAAAVPRHLLLSVFLI